MALPGLFRKVLNHLGFKKENEERRQQQQDGFSRNRGGGFSAKISVPVVADGPVVSECNYGNGGVQGLKWYSDLLRADDDGDVAQEFLKEGSYLAKDHRKRLRLEVQRRTRPVKLKGPLCALDGNVHQFVEFGGDIHWA